MLGGFLLLRRAMLDELGGFDEGFRLYGEDIDLAYRAMQRRLGALVRAGRGRAPRAPGRDRPALAHAAHALALGGHRPLRAQAPRDGCARCEHAPRSSTGIAEGYAEHDYADPGALRARGARSSIVELGPRLEPGDDVLDLGCGDADMARAARGARPALPRRRRAARG